MAPVLGGVYWHHYLVPGAGRDLLITAWAAVHLLCLIRLNVAHLDCAKITQAQNSRSRGLRSQQQPSRGLRYQSPLAYVLSQD